MADTSIEWTDVTWNPVAGCTVLYCRLVARIVMRCAWRRDSKQWARLNIKVSLVGPEVEQDGMELFGPMKPRL